MPYSPATADSSALTFKDTVVEAPASMQGLFRTALAESAEFELCAVISGQSCVAELFFIVTLAPDCSAISTFSSDGENCTEKFPITLALKLAFAYNPCRSVVLTLTVFVPREFASGAAQLMYWFAVIEQSIKSEFVCHTIVNVN